MLHNMTDETFELMLKVHNTAPFRLIREAAPYLRSKDPKVIASNRSIVTISSTSGIHGNTGQANYATAKAGVLGLTKTIAKVRAIHNSSNACSRSAVSFRNGALSVFVPTSSASAGSQPA